MDDDLVVLSGTEAVVLAEAVVGTAVDRGTGGKGATTGGGTVTGGKRGPENGMNSGDCDTARRGICGGNAGLCDV